MATVNQFRQLHSAEPFTAFTVRTAGGKTFTIKHPEHAAVSLNGSELAVMDEEGTHLIEMLLVEELARVKEPIDQPVDRQ